MKDKPAVDKFEIFPYLMVRYASGDHKAFESLRYPDMDNMNSHLKTLQSEVRRFRDMICDYLYQLVPQVSSITDKQFLITLKRDIFNGRELEQDALKKFMKILTEEQKQEYQAYVTSIKQLKDFHSDFQQKYSAHLSNNRRHLQELSMNELFLKGVRLSSKVLYDQLAQFATADVGSFKSRELRQEYSLTRYLTRMFFKTSPFSTFTYLGLGILTDNHSLRLPSSDTVNSHIRLNNEIFSYLSTMLSLNPEINEEVYIQFNPTIETREASITFMVNFRNLESFQKTNDTPLLKALLRVRDEQPSPLRLKQIVKKLSGVINATPSEIKAYLLKLVEIGFLEFDFQTSGVSPEWDNDLLSNLKAIRNPNPLLLNTMETLSLLHNNCQRYARENIHQRNALLEAMHHQFDMLFTQFQESLGLGDLDKENYRQKYQASFDTEKFRKHPYLLPTLNTESLIYEDCFTETPAQVNREEMKKIVSCVNEIFDVLEPLDGSSVEKNRMNDFFVKQYEKDEDVPLLDFYRDYYSNVRTPTSGLPQPEIDDPDQYRQAFVCTYNQLVDQLKTLIKDIDPTGEEISLNKNLLKDMNPAVKKSTGPVSRAMFAQCFSEQGKLIAVVNNVFLGMGRASGRFLHLFDPSVTEQLKEFNNRMSGDALLMELSDGSYFNANTHPPLLPFELKIPDGHNSLPLSGQIPVKDILVYFDGASNVICLRHRSTGKRVLPFDLCLQSIAQRSKLYQLLANFSQDQSLSFLPIQRAIQQVIFERPGWSEKREIYYFPRIVYDEKVILKRKSWSALTSSVPRKGDQQSDADYFMQLNQWRKNNNLPSQIFLYLKPRSSENVTNSSDDYKPQYIRFDTPLLVLLWSKLLKKAGEYIYFEEMMPGTEALNGNRVNEFLVQWYMN